MSTEPAIDLTIRDLVRAQPRPAADPGRVLADLVRALDTVPQRRLGPVVAPWKSGRTATIAALTAASIVLVSMGAFLATDIAPRGTEQVVPAALTSPAATDTVVAPAAETGPTLEWVEMSEQEYAAAHGPGVSFDDGKQHRWQADGFGYRVAVRPGKLTDRDGSRQGSPAVPGGWEPLEVAVERPDGTIARSTFDRPLRARGHDIVVSSAGVLLTTEPFLSDRLLFSFVTGLARPRDCCRLDADGTIHVSKGTKGVKAGKIRLSDYAGRLSRIGLTTDDVLRLADDARETSQTWYSSDGETWQEVHPPTRFNLVGTEAGFFAGGPEHEVSSSTDGIEWSTVLDVRPTSLRPVGDRVATMNDDGGVWNFDGEVWVDQSGATGPFLSGTDFDDTWYWASTPIGLLLLKQDNETVIFTPDGEHWSRNAMPDEWVVPHGFVRWSADLQSVGGELLLVDLEDSGKIWRAVVSEATS